MPQEKWQINQALARRVRAGDVKARETMILANLELARYAASKYRRHHEMGDDLRQAALVGLIKAVDNYDPGLMASFSHYASFTIAAELSRAFERATALMPIGNDASRRRVTRKVPRLASAAAEKDETLTALDVAKALDLVDADGEIDIAHGRDILDAACARTVQLGHSINHDDDGGDQVFDVAEDVPTFEEKAVEAEERQATADTVQAALSLLSDVERAVVVARTMGEVAESYARLARRLKLSEDEVKAIEAQALGRLRELL